MLQATVMGHGLGIETVYSICLVPENKLCGVFVDSVSGNGNWLFLVAQLVDAAYLKSTSNLTREPCRFPNNPLNVIALASEPVL
jgi:hypothetical protein